MIYPPLPLSLHDRVDVCGDQATLHGISFSLCARISVDYTQITSYSKKKGKSSTQSVIKFSILQHPGATESTDAPGKPLKPTKTALDLVLDI